MGLEFTNVGELYAVIWRKGRIMEVHYGCSRCRSVRRIVESCTTKYPQSSLLGLYRVLLNFLHP